MVIVDEHGDLDIFDSVEAAESYLEAIDVINDEFVIYDDEGRVLDARANSVTSPVSIDVSPESPVKSDELASKIRSFLRRAERADDQQVEGMNLNDLVALLWQTSGKATG